ncbi:hypothetical protein J1N35_001457 [Gossypium stocksii]|uniref:Uncharacterized protein n=1 Tax=Gossypium stocksii TaxID=47602 RepID=A0A9D3WK47_9ROSI|nr:hypothetical protein J1N35_001457 [Gossypium stocksii]
MDVTSILKGDHSSRRSTDALPKKSAVQKSKKRIRLDESTLKSESSLFQSTSPMEVTPAIHPVMSFLQTPDVTPVGSSSIFPWHASLESVPSSMPLNVLISPMFQMGIPSLSWPKFLKSHPLRKVFGTRLTEMLANAIGTNYLT